MTRSKPCKRLDDERNGFTLVELLVVIAIIGILISIILPAINSVRMSTRATVCKNNLRQLAMGIQAYTEGSDGRLPAQWRTASQTRWENFSWSVAVLPMIDQQNIRNQLVLDQPPLSEQNQAYTSISIPVFECPATPSQPRTIPMLGADNYSITNLNAAARDYAAIHSITSVDGRSLHPGAWNGQGRSVEINQREGVPPDSDALFHSGPGTADIVDDSFNSQVRTIQAPISRIRDGLSNTALLIEQAGKPGIHGTATTGVPSFEGPWATAELNNFSGDGVNSDNQRDPFSFHRSVNVAMCDTSVHAWSASIDPVVMRSLMSSAGGEIVDLTDIQ